MDQPTVVSVARKPTHSFSKSAEPEITLVAGLGVQGDAHSGKTVKHRSRVRKDPTQPNLRQVHLVHSELLSELRSKGFEVNPGDMGENITTCGLDILALPQHSKLVIGEAVIEVTGLRNPCSQLDNFQTGLMAAVLDKDSEGNLVRKAGIMGIVLNTGSVQAGNSIEVQLPPLPHLQLEPV